MVATSDAVARVRYVSLLTTTAMVAFAVNSVLCSAALGGGEIDSGQLLRDSSVVGGASCERPAARSRPSDRRRFSRPDHGIRFLVFYLTDTNMECVTFHATKLFGHNERLFLTEPCRSPIPPLAPV